jgi:hypothetical protein
MAKFLEGIQTVAVNNFPATQPISGTVTASGTVFAQNKISAYLAITSTALTTATPVTQTAQDNGSTPAYKIYRVAVLFDQPVRIDFYNGSSSTLTSNKILQTVTVAANTPTTVDFPISARYYGVKITNTGAATTTSHLAQGVSFSQ